VQPGDPAAEGERLDEQVERGGVDPRVDPADEPEIVSAAPGQLEEWYSHS
jgi:hypothetical protein